LILWYVWYLVNLSLKGDGEDLWVQGEELVDGELLDLRRNRQELRNTALGIFFFGLTVSLILSYSALLFLNY
jgi:hypothetical protein